MGMVQKQGNWVPYELKPGNFEHRICTCELLLKRQNRKVFLHRIVTGDEKWIHYENPKLRKSWVKPSHASTSTAKPNIHGKKLMLCIWWDQFGVIYYELLQPNETITGERYQQQLMRLSRALKIKRPLYAKRHDKVIYQHDNARPHVAKVVKETLEALQWDVLPHPLYSPDIAPSDYHITISRRLVANGLHSCRPLRRLPLTPPNRRQRLEWCRARSTWMTEWHRVVFSDESRFCLSSDSRRVRVWRRRGERSNPAAIVERPTVRQRGIIVWGAIAYDSRSPLLRIQGTMTAQRYVDDVLRPVTLPYLQGVPNALYQQDNARQHTARISQQALQDVQMLPWPPYSPDLSPIEHVWDIIGRRLHALPQPPSEDELWQMVEREWRAIPQDAIRTLIDSLPRRVAACIAVRGGPTCY
ncbi:hypothetical protein LAZ67_21001679 [Cordylochernes scorpioides]|uniref:Transposase n=1 Tax=Cordylochernes scorpioides TaxID=51811 RepID=A0ABY6LMG7_9ARAC|nr:hypothetical protein LAZ67_21001679 [Cordylochernes scorpioides]